MRAATKMKSNPLTLNSPNLVCNTRRCSNDLYYATYTGRSKLNGFGVSRYSNGCYWTLYPLKESMINRPLDCARAFIKKNDNQMAVCLSAVAVRLVIETLFMVGIQCSKRQCVLYARHAVVCIRFEWKAESSTNVFNFAGYLGALQGVMKQGNCAYKENTEKAWHARALMRVKLSCVSSLFSVLVLCAVALCHVLPTCT